MQTPLRSAPYTLFIYFGIILCSTQTACVPVPIPHFHDSEDAQQAKAKGKSGGTQLFVDYDVSENLRQYFRQTEPIDAGSCQKMDRCKKGGSITLQVNISNQGTVRLEDSTEFIIATVSHDGKVSYNQNDTKNEKSVKIFIGEPILVNTQLRCLCAGDGTFRSHTWVTHTNTISEYHNGNRIDKKIPFYKTETYENSYWSNKFSQSIRATTGPENGKHHKVSILIDANPSTNQVVYTLNNKKEPNYDYLVETSGVPSTSQKKTGWDFK